MASALMGHPAESTMGSALAAVDKLGDTLKAAVSQAQLVQSNISDELGRIDAFSIYELEQQARKARAAFILRTVKAVFFAIDNWFARRAQSELEGYLAASQNLADLESRMRRYTDKRSPFNSVQPY